MRVQVLLDVSRPETHLVRVALRLPAAEGGDRRLRMPAWVPGSYKIRDFGRHVQDLVARVGGVEARVEQTTKDEWVVRGSAGRPVEVVYDVYCRELTVDTSHVTADHAHVFPATVLLYDEHSRGLPHRVQVKAPKGWRVWSGLETDALDGTLTEAADYDHLIDCPIECGPPEDYFDGRFEVRGRAHRLVVWRPPPRMDGERLLRDLRAVVEATARVFGGLPYDHYTFLCHTAREHGGGLEHRNSTVLGADPLHLVAEEKIRTRFLPLVAHEFFHTWNVKRILPAAFQPYALQQESYTTLLWLFEGFTSYYELPVLARAGVVDDESWGKLAAEMLLYYEMALGRRRRPVAEASRLTWTLLYQPHEHNINRNVSYYTKGLFVGLCLDAHLRRRGVRDGLDAVMRHVWKKHGARGLGVPEDAFPAFVEEATGVDCRALLRRWVHGTEELPIDRAFRTLGWEVKREWKDEKRNLGLGVHFREGTARIEKIPEDSPAHAVLQPDDEMVAVEGVQWSQERLTEAAAGRQPGDALRLAFFREGRLREADVPLRELPKDKISIVRHKGDASAARRRTEWLGDRMAAKAGEAAPTDRPAAKRTRKAPRRKATAR